MLLFSFDDKLRYGAFGLSGIESTGAFYFGGFHPGRFCPSGLNTGRNSPKLLKILDET